MPRPTPDDHDALVKGVRLRGERHRRWLRDGELSLARRLAQIGVLGWIVVMPVLAGVFAGGWLDRTCHSGLLFTGALLVVGVALGCWSAWNWMTSA